MTEGGGWRRWGGPSSHSPTLNLPQHKSYLLTEMQVHTDTVGSKYYTILYISRNGSTILLVRGTTHIQFIKHSSDLVGKGSEWQSSFKNLRYRYPGNYKMKYVYSSICIRFVQLTLNNLSTFYSPIRIALESTTLGSFCIQSRCG